MRVISDWADAPPAATRRQRSATTLCASRASKAVCEDKVNQLFHSRSALLIVFFPIRSLRPGLHDHQAALDALFGVPAGPTSFSRRSRSWYAVNGFCRRGTFAW